MHVDSELLREIETSVAEEVARFGVAGEVRIVGNRVVLEGYGPASVADLGALLEQWDQLSQDVRARRATALARRLVEARRASIAPTGAKRRSHFVPRFVAPLVILAAGGVGIWFAYGALTPGGAPHTTHNVPQPKPQPGQSDIAADDYESQRMAREGRVCEATRLRVQRGATVGPTDVEGWVVELTLLRSGGESSLTFDPALTSFVERRAGSLDGKFVWAGAPQLKARQGPSTKVLISDASIPNPDKPRLYGVTLQFTGRYVISYFSEPERIDYHKTAHTLAERLGADYAGLFARCAQSQVHQVGSWFWGPGPGGAAASVIYFMGAYAEPTQIKPQLLFPQGGSDLVASAALLNIAERTADLKRARVLRLLGNTGGMMAGRPDAPHTISFPFKDSNRASRASLDLAREVDVAVKN